MPVPKFICTVGGNSFEDETPQIDINGSDMMTISLSDGVYDINLRAYNFSSINASEVVYFSIPSMGIVTKDAVTYSNTCSGPPYDGELIFTKKESDKLSGTFHFKAQAEVTGVMIIVKDGSFEDIMY